MTKNGFRIIDSDMHISYAAGERPEAVMAYLNTLFDFMIDVVNEHHGSVNKFLGDGFMAVFGAPIEDTERCGHAVGASLEILERLDRLNAAGKIHPTRVGIGLHMDEAVTGNVGSTERKENTVMYLRQSRRLELLAFPQSNIFS
jgi:adenylate cyclase